MTSAIARWHSSARPPSDALELAYADRLEAEMQELAIQLHKVGGRQGAGGYVQKWQERCLEIDTCREGHSDRTERAESMTAPTVKEMQAGPQEEGPERYGTLGGDQVYIHRREERG